MVERLQSQHTHPLRLATFSAAFFAADEEISDETSSRRIDLIKMVMCNA